jgi:hypothetical protein
MSMREKLAWAKEHGVAPPDYVLVAAAEEAADDEPASCCERSKLQAAACSSALRDGGCCSNDKRANCSNCSHENEAPVEWVIGIHAQKCQGLSLLWITTGAIAPPPAVVELPTDSNPTAWYVPSLPGFWQSLSKSPDVPPPRLS